MYRYFDENSWKLDCVRKAETVSELASLVNEQVLAQVFDMFCEPMAGGEADEYSLRRIVLSINVVQPWLVYSCSQRKVIILPTCATAYR